MENRLKEALANCKTLPTMPVVAAQIVEVIGDDDFGLNDIAEVVCKDPAISTKLVATANSAAYRGVESTSDINHAISRLGVKATVMIALSFSLAGSHRKEAGPQIDTQSLWRRSVVSAAIARLLARQLHSENAEGCFLAGLVQDIGILATSQACPDVYAGLVNANHDVALQVERSMLETDHAEVGAWLLQQWNMPMAIVRLVASSHEFSNLTRGAEDPGDAWCVAASGVLADAMLSHDEIATGRSLSLIESICSLDATTAIDLKAQVAETIEEAEALFETSLVTDPLALLESSKSLLFDQMITDPPDASERKIERLERRVSALEAQERFDKLTGAVTRAHFERDLSRVFAEAAQRQEAMSLMFIDADHFKQINDKFGHLAGDEVLKWLAKTLKESVRGTDIVGRYGGEEFVVILPTLGEQDATDFGERICNRLRNSVVSIDKTSVHLTVSIGIASTGGSSDFTDIRELVFAADQAMYFAKQSGRNLCVGASTLPNASLHAQALAS